MEYCRSIVSEYKRVMGLPPDRQLRYVSTPLDDNWPSEEACPQWSEPGFHANLGAKWCGRLLYLSRMARGGIATAVGRLGRQLCAWSRYTDLCLKRLISYLDTHDSYALEVTVEEGAPWHVRAFVDADHAGDAADSKSCSEQGVSASRGICPSPLSRHGMVQCSVAKGAKRIVI